MINTIINLFLRPSGAISAKQFWLGFVGLSVFVYAVNTLLRAMEMGGPKFTVALIFPFLALYIIYCVYGKRLHDMGFSVWPLTGIVTAEILVMIGVMLAFGGAEYFEGFAQYDKKAVIDEAVREALIKDYQTEQAAHLGEIKAALWVLPIVFTAWLALAPKRARKPRR